MKDKENQIEEMANCFNCVCKPVCMKTADINKEQELLSWNEYVKQYGCKGYQPKLPKDSIVLSREEYEEYQSFKNGDYCATNCDIHELSFNQMNKISELESENEKLKKEIKNPNEVLEDRERFRARNEELKETLEQLRQEIITLSQELVNSRKETAENILNTEFFIFETENRGEEYQKGYMQAVRECRSRKDELAKQFVVEIKEDND